MATGRSEQERAKAEARRERARTVRRTGFGLGVAVGIATFSDSGENGLRMRRLHRDLRESVKKWGGGGGGGGGVVFEGRLKCRLTTHAGGLSPFETHPIPGWTLGWIIVRSGSHQFAHVEHVALFRDRLKYSENIIWMGLRFHQPLLESFPIKIHNYL